MTDDIYNPPNAAPMIDSTRRRRPPPVWLIFIFSWFSLIGIVVHLVALIQPDMNPLAPYYPKPNGFDAQFVAFGLFTFYSALTLFRLKKLAVRLCWLYAAILAMGNLHKYVTQPGFREVINTQLETVIVVLVAWIVFLLWYVHHLDKKGVLQP